MRGRYKLVIALGAATIAGAAFWPQLGFGQSLGSVTHDSNLDRVVTKHFDNANVNQVFAWLVEQGFSYVIADANLDTTRVSLNIDHQTVWEAAQALADALGGHWTRDGRIYVFHRGSAGMGQSGFAYIMPDSKELKTFQIEPDRMEFQPKLFAMPMNQQAMSPEQQEKYAQSMEEWAKKFSGQFNAKDFQGQPGIGPDMEKKLELKLKDLPMMGQNGSMSPEEQEKFAKKMEEWAQKFSSQFNGEQFDGAKAMSPEMEEKLRGMEDKIREEMKNMPQIDGSPQMEKQLQERMHRLEDSLKNMPNIPQGNMSPDQLKVLKEQMGDMGRQFGPDGPKGWNGQNAEEFAKKWEEWGEKFGQQFGPDGSPNAPRVLFKNLQGMKMPNGKDYSLMVGQSFLGDSNLRRLMDSLTPEQKAKQDSKGYLTPSDLTPKQRAMFDGLESSRTWDLNFDLDGRKLHIKSK